MLLIDTDNAMGSPRGDVDDGFALLALLASSLPIQAVCATHGNTTANQAHRNNQRLVGEFRPDIPCLSAAETPCALKKFTGKVLGLGPMTNLTTATTNPGIEELVMVGTNFSSRGRFPPLWPFEYNLTKDINAFQTLFKSPSLPLTILPLDVARRLRVSPRQLTSLGGKAGEYLNSHSLRWVRRSPWRYGSFSFPVWDLAAALYLISPRHFEIRSTTAQLHPNGWVQYGVGSRPVSVILDYDADLLWDFFVRLLASRGWAFIVQS